jgi:hypothetical protein
MNMKNGISGIGRLAAIWFLASNCAISLAQEDYRVVFVRNKQICLTGPSKAVNCLAGDNRDKLLPVWSREGDRIAYVEIGSTPSALATLFVIDPQGKRLGEVPLKVVEKGEIRSGMRQVESLEWIAGNRLVASGSINPSSTEHLVVDTSQMKVVDELVSDGFGATFSPDGLSYIAVTGQPHFTKKESRSPSLIINSHRLPNLVPDQAEIAGAPSWAPDGSTVAIPLRYAASTSSAEVEFTVLWLQDSKEKRSIVVPANTRKLAWGASGLIATTLAPGQQAGAVQVWELPIVTRPFQMSGWRLVNRLPSVDAENRGRKLTAELRGWLKMDSESGIDIWCKGCDLSGLPRRVPKS